MADTLPWAKRMAAALAAIRADDTAALLQTLTGAQDPKDGGRPLDFAALLMVAVNYERVDAVAAVLGAGADPGAVAEGLSMVDRAAAVPDRGAAASMVRLLVEAGAPPPMLPSAP